MALCDAPTVSLSARTSVSVSDVFQVTDVMPVPPRRPISTTSSVAPDAIVNEYEYGLEGLVLLDAKLLSRVIAITKPTPLPRLYKPWC